MRYRNNRNSTRYIRKMMTGGVVAVMMTGMLTGCNGASGLQSSNDSTETSQVSSSDDATATSSNTSNENTEIKLATASDTSTADANAITLKDGEDITIDKAGDYVITGSASNSTIYVEAGDEDEVNITLAGASIINDVAPCIYVKSADKVIINTSDTESTLTVSGTFEADGDTNLDAVIFSKDDLDIEGSGTLNITSSDNAISCKDTLTVNSGTLNINCSGSALEAHDEIEITDGTINVESCNDGLHAEDSDDDTIGAILISGGTINITAADDAIHATTTLQIDGGDLTLNGAECLEGTVITVNDGNVNINASDDGINAAAKSGSYTPSFEMNGGNVTISMGAGDTDGVDSNGNITINGGTLDITGQSTFDYDGTATYNGGTIIENGTETNSISNQQFGGQGGGMMGGQGGMMGGQGGMMNEQGEMPGPRMNGDRTPPERPAEFNDENAE